MEQLCPECASLNYAKRLQSADLAGRVFLVTGARVKIGFHTALKLLRCAMNMNMNTSLSGSGTMHAHELKLLTCGRMPHLLTYSPTHRLTYSPTLTLRIC